MFVETTFETNCNIDSSCKKKLITADYSKQMIENFEALLSSEEVTERVVNILRSYKKRLKNRYMTQNKYLLSWEKYAQVVFKKANIPEKYNYFLIKITIKNFNKEEEYIKNILIKAINSYNKKNLKNK